ncbi:DUF6074 family protein [Aureimonas altamirensis]|uniref:DUF6074 family protein n=1 Tax=Aureimonas altamirensis TaxID=370622 RepID=UPI001E2C0C7D|nr:DUF6074 family protein [Aureimonas altamirensis]UHD44152.1 DUF6074 family protein [Aureimonas altamirensis]
MSETLPGRSYRPKAAIVPFPLANRIAKIRHVARLLRDHAPSARPAYWRKVLLALERQMARQGVAPAVIGWELLSFRDAVKRACRPLDPGLNYILDEPWMRGE